MSGILPEPEFEPVQANDEQLFCAASDENFLEILEDYPIGQAVGFFQRVPWRLDFNWLLQAGADPRPFSDLDLARIKHSIQTGGAVMVLATERAALDIALQAIDAEFSELKVVN